MDSDGDDQLSSLPLDISSVSSSQTTLASPSNDSSENDLPPTKIQRTYKCKECTNETTNPRAHLRHLGRVHGKRVKIVKCPYCLYACQYRQKLNRHLNLIHHIENGKKGSNDESDETSQPLDLSLPPRVKEFMKIIAFFNMLSDAQLLQSQQTQ